MIILEGLSKEYGARSLFGPVNLVFPVGERIALVGPNGAGKSTLLRIITGESEPSRGKVVVPRNTSLGYLPQEPNQNPHETLIAECMSGAEQLAPLEKRMQELLKKIEEDYSESVMNAYTECEQRFSTLGGYGLRSRAEEILEGLGFSTEQFEKSPLSLSGGWRMRLELAKIFLNAPDVLLLDEPTNHLDLPSLVWVENYLQHFTDTLVFVSHDRPLLNRLSTITLELSQGALTFYRGNFDFYIDQKELKQLQASAERAQIQRRKEELEDFVSRFGAKASKARQAQSRVKMLAKLRSIEASIPLEEAESSISLILPEPQKCERVVLKISGLATGYGEKKLASAISCEVHRGMKIAIIGANGIGKSTLLKTIIGDIPHLAGSIEWSERAAPVFFAQEQAQVLDLEATVVENILRVHPSVGERFARQLLGSLLFRGDDVFKKAAVLSGGEKNRVGLARILASRANILLLDEPTNHLDMSSVGVLGDALQRYLGTILFVSHDRDFIDEVCTHVFVMLADGRSALFAGKLEDYRRMAAVAKFPDIFAQK